MGNVSGKGSSGAGAAGRSNNNPDGDRINHGAGAKPRATGSGSAAAAAAGAGLSRRDMSAGQAALLGAAIEKLQGGDFDSSKCKISEKAREVSVEELFGKDNKKGQSLVHVVIERLKEGVDEDKNPVLLGFLTEYVSSDTTTNHESTKLLVGKLSQWIRTGKVNDDDKIAILTLVNTILSLEGQTVPVVDKIKYLMLEHIRLAGDGDSDDLKRVTGEAAGALMAARVKLDVEETLVIAKAAEAAPRAEDLDTLASSLASERGNGGCKITYGIEVEDADQATWAETFGSWLSWTRIPEKVIKIQLGSSELALGYYGGGEFPMDKKSCEALDLFLLYRFEGLDEEGVVGVLAKLKVTLTGLRGLKEEPEIQQFNSRSIQGHGTPQLRIEKIKS